MTEPKLRAARIAEAKRRVTAADLHDAHNNISRHIAEMRMLSDLIEADWRPEPEVDAVTLAAREWMKANSCYPESNISAGRCDNTHYTDAFRAGHAHAMKDLLAERERLRGERDAARSLVIKCKDVVLNATDRIADEGDRTYFGSTNDADDLRALGRELDELHWQIVRPPSPGDHR